MSNQSTSNKRGKQAAPKAAESTLRLVASGPKDRAKHAARSVDRCVRVDVRELDETIGHVRSTRVAVRRIMGLVQATIAQRECGGDVARALEQLAEESRLAYGLIESTLLGLPKVSKGRVADARAQAQAEALAWYHRRYPTSAHRAGLVPPVTIVSRASKALRAQGVAS